MSKIDTGGPAFPFPILHGKGAPRGLSMRDWFAGQALSFMQRVPYSQMNESAMQNIARDAYSIADAMIKQRDQSS